MGKLSLNLQTKSLIEMNNRKPYMKRLAGLEYIVLQKVYKGAIDTELLCGLLNIKKNQDVWDIGTGTGLVALTAKKQGARYVLATDLNPNAVQNTKRNSALLGLKIDVRKADVFGDINKRFDLITFNPPFTDKLTKKSYEISFWDKDHKTIRKFFQNVRSHLKKSGRAFICWSSFGKTFILKKIASEYGFALKELGRRKGKRDFVYYVYVLKQDLHMFPKQSLQYHP